MVSLIIDRRRAVWNMVGEIAAKGRRLLQFSKVTSFLNSPGGVKIGQI